MRGRHRVIRLGLAVLLALLGPGAGMLVAVALPSAAAPGETVATRDGVVRGSVERDHRSFTGIPFAAPPVGPRRFAAPAPSAPWSGTLSARKSKPACPQSFPVVGALYPSSEDCLYLDVYTPPAARSANLPVMVWLYGGSYLTGSSGQYDPTPLVTRGDVVVVQINYRVGPFGFLSLPGTTANAGLLDQQAGLRWVQRNVRAFGGDPARVTLFGESAGGNSVCHHLASPPAAGLFSRAIVMSGACGAPFLDSTPRAEAERIGLDYAAEVGCPAATAVACLRTKSRRQLLATDTLSPSTPGGSWRPTVDGVVVPRPTSESFASGRFARVPVMIGGVRDEGRFFVARYEHVMRLRRVDPARYETAVRNLFGDRTGQIVGRYSTTRFDSLDLALASVWTDGLFACPGLAATRSLAARVPTYAYEFDDARPPLADVDPLMPLRSYHGSDLWFLFDKVLGVPTIYLTAEQRALSAQMVDYWTTFARTGVPDGAGRPAWPTADTGTALKLAADGPTTTSLTSVSAAHDCGFWTG